MLNRIELRGFKSIRDMGEMGLELRSLNILIGANGAGKTNFIAIFQLLNRLVEGQLQLFVGQAGGADALLYFGQKTTSEIFIRLHFEPNGYCARLAPAPKDTLIFADEYCWFRGEGYTGQKNKPFDVPLGGGLGEGHRETNLPDEAQKNPGKVASYVLDTLKEWTVYHFHDTSQTAKVKQTGDIGDNATLRPDASNLAAFLYLLQHQHAEHYDRIVKTIRLVAPFFDDFVLRPSPFNKNKILLEWREQGSTAYFSAHSLSDGTLRFICLATLLLQPAPTSMILIDEPELGLHPYAITLLSSLLKSVAAKRQVIVSTQSVSLANQFSPEDIVVVDREGGQSVFKRLEKRKLREWIGEYGLGDLWEKNVIGGRPRR